MRQRPRQKSGESTLKKTTRKVTKKPRQNGVKSWKTKVHPKKESTRPKMENLSVVERRILPLAFELRQIADKNLTVEEICRVFDTVHGPSGYKRMSVRAIAAMRRLLKENSLHDWTR